MHIRLRSVQRGQHVETQVFAGEDRDHLALTGTLMLHMGEWQLFGAALLLGARQTKGNLTVDSPDGETMCAQWEEASDAK